MFKIGVMSDSFKLPIREGIKKAKILGAEGIQCYAVQGEMAPEHLAVDERAFIRQLCADNGLVISALCGDLGGHGFQIPEENTIKIPKSKAIVDLAVDLHTNVVTTHIGVVPDDVESPTYAIMADARGNSPKRDLFTVRGILDWSPYPFIHHSRSSIAVDVYRSLTSWCAYTGCRRKSTECVPLEYQTGTDQACRFYHCRILYFYGWPVSYCIYSIW